MDNIKLSENFSLLELTRSNTAIRENINNIPEGEDMNNLKRLAVEILQPIREKYGKPIRITSAYRCPALNKAVGGSKTSQHMIGQAADLVAINGTNAELFNCIKEMIDNGELKVGQLIWEYGTKQEPNWVHVSLPYRKVNNILYLFSKNK